MSNDTSTAMELWTLIINCNTTDMVYCGLLFKSRKMYVFPYDLQLPNQPANVIIKHIGIYKWDLVDRRYYRNVFRTQFNNMMTYL